MKTTITSNGQVIAQVIQNKGRRARGAWIEASNRFGALWLGYAKMLSGTQYASTRQLARMGHPYARRQFRSKGKGARGGLPAPDFAINRQSGRVATGWHVNVSAPGAAGNIRVSLTNTAPWFRWLHTGTKKMIRRPILQVSLAMARRHCNEIYGDAQKRVHGYR